jgi:fructose-1,6-bisphosphatase I
MFVRVIGAEPTMTELDSVLSRFAGQDRTRAAVARTIEEIASAAINLEAHIASALPGNVVASEVDDASDGRESTALGVIADNIFADALAKAPVAVAGSEKRETATILDPDGMVAVAIDPLSTTANLETNISIGAIFSVLPMTDDPARTLLQNGRLQLAAGFIIYGPQTCMALTLGDGTDIFVLDRHDRVFVRTRAEVRIPVESSEYAINAANYRHWDAPVQAFTDDNVAGADGPRGRNFNMRWISSLVAEAYRILIRGGIYLYPGDRRDGNEKGRRRLVYEANPLAMLVEQAGGLATDGEDDILDIQPNDLHQCVPLIFGSKNKVERVRAFHDGTLPLGEHSPLFGRRGLFRH